MKVTRYVRLMALQVKISALLAAQYRWNFFIDGAISVFWAATAIVPLFVVYGEASRPGIPGWSFGEALVVTGWFILLRGFLEGAINPALHNVIEHIRKGTLDFILLKPADTQFLVSTSRFEVWRIVNLGSAGVVLAGAFYKLGRFPSPTGVSMALLLLIIAIWLLYSLWILIISTAFYVVKMDNLTYLFSAIFDAARWPSAVFSGVLRFVFTFVIPLAMMTTYPAQALLGRLAPKTLAIAVLSSLLFATVARAVWLKSIRHYTSAGG